VGCGAAAGRLYLMRTRSGPGPGRCPAGTRRATAPSVQRYLTQTIAPAVPVATVMLSVVPGCILQLALTGPEAVSEAPRAVRALWP
jgi:hypothetical protein